MRFLPKSLLCAMAATTALVATSQAQAAISVSVWVDQPVAAGDATLAQAAALGAPSATTTVPFLDFSTSDSDATSIDTWLGSSIGGAVGSHALNNSYFLFTGSTFLHSGVNHFVVPHDDGLQLKILGIPGLVVDAPGPTSAVDTVFDVTPPSAGVYGFQMSYGECCGGPAVIAFTIDERSVTGAPEPATWAMLIAGIGLLGAAMRRRKSQVAYAF